MFLDTANNEEIKKYCESNWVSGVTTNPTLLGKEKGKTRDEIIAGIINLLNEKKLFLQVEGKTYQEMKEDSQYLLKHFPDASIGLKIQADEKGYKLIDWVKQKEPNRTILATVIFSTEQAYLSGLAGADWIAPYVNRMTNASVDPFKVIKDSKKIFEAQGISTKIMGASFKNQQQVIDSLLSGAHTNTLPIDILDGALNNKLAKESIDVFNQHVKERKKDEA